jgi:hypothetical protein
MPHTQAFDPGPIAAGLKLAELIGALSHALDITEGQPEGHCVRCCWIGMHLGRSIGLTESQQWELYYTLLLKDLGCSSNAARICELYLTDDLNFKRDFKQVGDSLPQVVRFVLQHTGLKAGLAERFRSVLHIFRHGPEVSQELIQTRCQRGAEIARLLRFSEGVAAGIYSLDEHWSGLGKPHQLSGTAIPVYARIALLAQVVDVFHTADGKEAAMDEVRRRSGQWFDPALVGAMDALATDAAFWSMLDSPDIEQAVLTLEPAACEVPLDEDYLDDIATAFGQVVDSKSPYTSGHSARGPVHRPHRRGHGFGAPTQTLAQARRTVARRGQARGEQQRVGQSGSAGRDRVGGRARPCPPDRVHPVQDPRIQRVGQDCRCTP